MRDEDQVPLFWCGGDDFAKSGDLSLSIFAAVEQIAEHGMDARPAECDPRGIEATTPRTRKDARNRNTTRAECGTKSLCFIASFRRKIALRGTNVELEPGRAAHPGDGDGLANQYHLTTLLEQRP